MESLRGDQKRGGPFWVFSFVCLFRSTPYYRQCVLGTIDLMEAFGKKGGGQIAIVMGSAGQMTYADHLTKATSPFSDRIIDSRCPDKRNEGHILKTVQQFTDSDVRSFHSQNYISSCFYEKIQFAMPLGVF